jgi:hypothetical protein
MYPLLDYSTCNPQPHTVLSLDEFIKRQNPLDSATTPLGFVAPVIVIL